MFTFLNEIDHSLFLRLNSYHNPSLDWIMIGISNSKTWIPFYLFLVYLIFKSHTRNKAIFYVLLTLISVGISDYIASGIFKPFFERFRPCHTDSLKGIMILVGECGGKFGFVSSHASTSFALAFSIFFIFKKKFGLYIFMIFWAILVGYSRIYLGVHFPIDIIFGAILGIIITFIVFKLFSIFYFKTSKVI
jgi:undecaprenyl-diphosphatase